MVRVTKDVADDAGLLEYLSSSEDEDIQAAADRDPDRALDYARLVPEITPPSSDFPNVLIIGNLPTPTMDRYEKLRNAITLRLKTSLSGVASDDFTVDVPITTDEKGEKIASGVCFVTFKKPQDMAATVETLNSVALGGKYMLRCARLDDFEPVLLEPEYVDFPAESVAFYRDHFRDWLADPLGREQFAYRATSGAEIMWFDGLTRTPEIVCKDHEKFGVAFCWSPRGSYFVTLHKRGVWVRADNDFAKKRRFTLLCTKHVYFSPDEEYLIGWDGSVNRPESPKEPSAVMWEVFTGKKICTLPVSWQYCHVLTPALIRLAAGTHSCLVIINCYESGVTDAVM